MNTERTNQRQYDCILWDLDGTLTESGTGIVNSVLYALDRMGIREDDRKKLEAFVGPPLLNSFREFYGMTDEQAEQAIRYYREYFSERGIFENAVYPGIPEALARLRQAGFQMAVATSKPEVFARRITDHFGLSQYFDYVGGSSIDEKRTKKAEVIRYVLDTLCLDAASGRIVMIGDRKHDVEGAAENGLSCIGVLFGYGSRAELETAGARAVCADARELTDTLLGC